MQTLSLNPLNLQCYGFCNPVFQAWCICTFHFHRIFLRQQNIVPKKRTLHWCCDTAQLLFTMTFIYVGNLAASFSIYYCCCYCLLHTGSFLNHLAFWEIFRNIEFAGSLWKKKDPVDLENSMCVNPIWLQIST